MARMLLLVCLLALMLPASGAARTWYINPDGTGDAPTIQAGIDSSSAGDTVFAAAGTYTGEGNRNLDFSGTDLVLLSEAGAGMTVIDCEGSARGFHFHSGETGAAVVAGFMITNGNSPDYGGGVFCQTGSSPTLVDCYFDGNSAVNNGGGLAAHFASPTLINCSFTRNSTNDGGGVFCWGEPSPTLSNCIFAGNSADDGGGMCCYQFSHPALTNCIFSGNSARCGGGMICWEDCSPNITDCSFTENSSTGDGGGLRCINRCSPNVINCSFSGNTDEDDGGGMFCFDSSSPNVANCTFSRNSSSDGGGVSCGHHSSPTLTNCTFFENRADVGGGIDCWDYSFPVLRSTIIAFSPAGEAVWCEPGSGIALTCCDIFGNVGGDWVGDIASQSGINGNLSAAPAFCDGEAGDLRLCDDSPCAPGRHPNGYECGLIGAWDVGCPCGPTSTVPTTWGAIKSMYR